MDYTPFIVLGAVGASFVVYWFASRWLDERRRFRSRLDWLEKQESEKRRKTQEG